MQIESEHRGILLILFTTYTLLCSHHVMPDLPQTNADPLEDAEIRYAITLSKEIQEKVRGRECVQMTVQPVITYLSFCQLELLKYILRIDQSR